MEKQKIELEYLLRTSPKILYNMISSPSGLSEWYADNVNLRGKNYVFIWDGSEEEALVLGKKSNEYIKFRWLEDEEEGEEYFFELRIRIDAITKEVALIVTDFAEEDEIEEVQMLWDNQVADLKMASGA